jgi:c(7)-type cytochrome triheme protein
MRLATIFLTLLVVVALAASAFAVGKGKTVEYAGGANGKVVFSGDAHGGSKCADCHTKIWPMKKGAAMKHADMNAGKGCGVCHDGKKAFKIDDQANCAKCHKK